MNLIGQAPAAERARDLALNALVLVPTVAIIAVGYALGRTGWQFNLGYGVAIAALLGTLITLRQRPLLITATLLLWLSIQRFAVAAVSPGIGVDHLRALLGYKELFFPLLAVVLLPRLVTQLRNGRGAPRVVDLLAVAFGLLVLAAIFLSPAPVSDRVLYARRLALLPLAYMVARLLPWTRRDFHRAVWLIVGFGLLLTLFGFVELFILEGQIWRESIPAAYFYHLSGLAGLNTPGTDFPVDGLPRVFYDFSTGTPTRRMVSTFLEATTLASFLALSTILAFARRPSLRSVAVGLTIGVGTFLTLSKAGIGIAGAGLAYLVASAGWPRLRSPLWILSMAAGLLGALLIIAFALSASGVTTGSLAHFRGLREGVESITTAPLGIGLGMGGGFAATLVGSESTFGVLLVQLGIPGLLLWGGWLVAMACLCALAGGRSNDEAVLGPAIAIALIGFFGTASLTESSGGLLGNWAFAFIAGALIAVSFPTRPAGERVNAD